MKGLNLLIGAIVILSGCSTLSVPYQVPYNSLTPGPDDEFSVGINASTVTIADKDAERYRTALIGEGAWTFLNKPRGALSLRLSMYTHTSTGVNRKFVSTGSWILLEYYKRKEVSLEKPFGLIYGMYLGIFSEFGNHVSQVLSLSEGWIGSQRSINSTGMLGGIWVGLKFYSGSNSRYFIKIHLGGSGGVTFTYRYKDFDFYFGTHIAGTVNSPYPVSALGIAYRF